MTTLNNLRTKFHKNATASLKEAFYDARFHVFWGEIYGDKKGRYPDGTRIHTSVVTYIHTNSKTGKVDYIETLNSAYTIESLHTTDTSEGEV